MLALAGGAEGEALSRPLAALRDGLVKVEAQLGRGAGPFFLGERFSLVDACYAPFLRRWRMAQGWGAPEAQLLSGLPRVSAWAEAVLRRPSVAAAEPAGLDAKSRSFYARRYAKLRAA
jgi:glutathione S-transferase